MSERSFRRDRERRVATAKRREALRKRRAGLVGGIAVGAFVLAPQAAQAANFEVNTLNDGVPDASPGACTTDADGCTLREAINDSNVSGSDDTITFQAGLTGTITLDQGRLVVNKNNSSYSTTITGPGADDISVSGDYTSLVFEAANTGSGLTISGLTVENGYDDAAGGIYARENTDVTLTDSTVTGNTATGVRDKYEFFGGGGITNRGTMLIQDSLISDNYANSYIPQSGPPFPYGGGGGVNNLGGLTITGSTITENGSAVLGGGILEGITKYPVFTYISETTISDNGAPYGGGIEAFNFFASPGASHSQITDSTISGNEAVQGGGMDFKYLGGSHHWLVDHSTVSGNGVFEDGGGLNFGFVPGSVELLDSTISGNYAQFYGGGGYISSGAQKYQDAVQFNNSTIASNYAGSDGGGLYLDYTDPDDAANAIPLFSTIVGNNNASSGLNDLAHATDASNPSGGAFDLSFSLVRAPGNATITQTPAGSNLLGVDPQLGGLASNGGPTETHLPSINSPVVDKGSAPGNLLTDQRGDPRTVDTSVANAHDGTDIGSVELATGPPGPPPPPAAGGTKVGTLKKKHKKRRRVIRTKNKVAKVRITFRSGTPGVTFRCSVDSGPFAPCTSPFTAKVTSAPGKGKNHNIAIQQVDAAGNQVGNVRVFKFRVVLKD
jgi:Right handed beta helix region